MHAEPEKLGPETGFSTRERLVNRVLRVGTAFAFLYPPLRALSDPIAWLGYLPGFIRTLPAQIGFSLDSLALLHGFGIIEAALAVWILFGRDVRIPATLAAMLLFAITIFNWAYLDIVFRDLSIAAMALALALQKVPPLPNALRRQLP